MTLRVCPSRYPDPISPLSYTICFLPPNCPLVVMPLWTAPPFLARALLDPTNGDTPGGADESIPRRAGLGVVVVCL